MGQAEKIYITEQEYIESERLSDVKHEYFQGEIFAMSGASIPHIEISMNISVDLATKLKGKKCRPYGSDMRMNIPENTLYTYPDLSVYCDEVETLDDNKDTAKKPTVIFEILSKSTRNYDQGEKFALYRQIPTLKEYILIDSEQIKVILNSKNENSSWNLTEFTSINDIFEIKSLAVDIRLVDIYEDVIFVK